MRNDLQESGLGAFCGAARRAPADLAALAPSAVDAALSDESAPLVVAQDRRREVDARGSGKTRMAVDRAHPASTGVDADDRLIDQLARQLNQLEAQQRQICRLLEQTLHRAPLMVDAVR